MVSASRLRVSASTAVKDCAGYSIATKPRYADFARVVGGTRAAVSQKRVPDELIVFKELRRLPVHRCFFDPRNIVCQTARRRLGVTCGRRWGLQNGALEEHRRPAALKEHTNERSSQAVSGVWLRTGTA